MVTRGWMQTTMVIQAMTLPPPCLTNGFFLLPVSVTCVHVLGDSVYVHLCMCLCECSHVFRCLLIYVYVYVYVSIYPYMCLYICRWVLKYAGLWFIVPLCLMPLLKCLVSWNVNLVELAHGLGGSIGCFTSLVSTGCLCSTCFSGSCVQGNLPVVQ